jgi:hypothetical protein
MDEWIERELQQALARREPSPDFAARVVAAARRRSVWKMPRWPAVAVAASMLLAAGVAYHRHRGQEAKDQVMLAVKLTARELNRIQTRIKEVSQ